MIKAKLIFYRISHITDELNFKIDNLDGYLEANNTDKVILDKFQYLPIELNTEITISHEQLDGLAEKENNTTDLFPYNYLKVEDNKVNNPKPYYFFVKPSSWASANSVTLQLKLDVINTFNSNLFNGNRYNPSEVNFVNDYNISEVKSRVFRAMKDRFEYKMIFKNFRFTISECDHNIELGLHTYRYYIRSPFEFSNITYDPSNLPEGSSSGANTSHTALYNQLRITITNASEISGSVVVVGSYKVKALVKKIDILSEGLTPNKYKQDEKYILDSNENVNWYLLYKNKDIEDEQEKIPFECYLVSDKKYSLVTPNSWGSIPYSDVTASRLYSMCNLDQSVRVRIEISAGVYKEFNFYNYVDEYESLGDSFKRYSIRGIFFERVGTSLSVYEASQVALYKNGTLQSSTLTILNTYTGLTTIDVVLANSDTAKTLYQAGSGIYPSDSFLDGFEETFALTQTYYVQPLITIDEVNKSDSRNIKLIAIPYKPFELRYYNNIDTYIYAPDGYEYDSTEKMIKISDNLLNLEYEFNSVDYNCKDELIETSLVFPLPTYRSYTCLDPKLLHSDFYNKKIVYDTFSYDINLEELDTYNLFKNSNESLKEFEAYDYLKSKNLNSNFIISFKNLKKKYSSKDYDNILIVNRNNDLALYSNQYLNYLRTGYNFDVKAKNRQQISSVLSVGNSILGSFGSIVNGNPLGASSSIANAINSVMGIAQAEDNLNAKIKSLQGQSTNVINNDDFDILQKYSNNKLKMITYAMESNMEHSIDNLFRLYGYVCVGNMRDQTADVYSSRTYYNYIQADIVITETRQMKQEWIEEIKKKYSEGITIIHYANGTWDVSQQYENYEVSLFY